MSKIIFSVSGVRGIYGENLTPEIAIKYSLAYSVFCKKNSLSRKIIIGRDGRLYGDELSSAVANAMAISGFDVTNLDIVPTPTVQLAVEKLNAAGGIVITASHNPQQWNGLKFLDSDGTFLKSNQIADVKKYLKIKKIYKANFSNFNKIRNDFRWLDKHINLVLKSGYININKIKKRKFKIVVDCVNASGSVIIPKLLRLLGCEVVELFCDSSGIFPHTPEPLPQNLKLLSKAVIKNKADMGLAIDPDADRLVVICENGEPFIEENTIVTAIRSVLRFSKKTEKNVVVNLSTTRAADDVARDFGAVITRSPVGEINVVMEMKKHNAVIGGEGSGGVILPKIHYGRDSVVAASLILNELAGFKGKISDYKKTLPQYEIVKTIVNCNDVSPKQFLKRAYKFYKNENCKITLTDGVKLDFDNYWFHLRMSNTEPIVRLICEAKTKKLATKYISEFYKNLDLNTFL